MTYKSIMAIASGAEEDARVLSATAKLAKRCAAEVRVVPAFPDPAADRVYYGAALQGQVSAQVMDQIRASEREAQTRLEDLARRFTQNEGLALDILVEPRQLSPASSLARAAVLGDLIIFGGLAVRDQSALGGLYAEILLNARSTTLIVKDGEWNTEAIAIAWDGSAGAGRAVRASLPLLQMAKQVLILTNADDAGSIARPAEPERLQAYLSLHGVSNTAARALGGDDVAKSLLDAAQVAECGVLVAGAYGRPRLFELALGGTTRALVNAEHSPHLLLAH